MSRPLRDRADAMLERVTLEATFHLGSAGAARVRSALAAALAPRDVAVDDDHDPRLLHPARTALILLSDAGCRDTDVLAAATFIDTVDVRLTPDGRAVEEVAGAAARRLAEAVPVPHGDGDADLLERLVTAPPDAALIALAERLDHARHLHLRDDIDWPAFHGSVEAVYAPAAARLSPVLARRLERWAEAFRARRLLRRRG